MIIAAALGGLVLGAILTMIGLAWYFAKNNPF